MNEKFEKPVHRDGIGFRSVRTQPEIRANSDPDYEEFARPSRNRNNLPSSFDTQLISKIRSRSWKDRCKKPVQWLKSKIGQFERDRMINKATNDLLSQLKNHDGWLRVDMLHYPFAEEIIPELLKFKRIELKSKNWMNVIFIRLVKKGK